MLFAGIITTYLDERVVGHSSAHSKTVEASTVVELVNYRDVEFGVQKDEFPYEE